MLKYVCKRIVLMLISAFIIMTMLFVMIRLLPNTVAAVQGGYDVALKQMREAWGYNKPIMVQYAIFLKNVFTEFNWGFCTEVGTFLQPVTEYLADKLPYTVYVNFVSVLFSIPLGVIFGILAAIFKNKWQDQVINVFIMIFISVPSFVYAFVLQYYVGYKHNLPTGYERRKGLLQSVHASFRCNAYHGYELRYHCRRHASGACRAYRDPDL